MKFRRDTLVGAGFRLIGSLVGLVTPLIGWLIDIIPPIQSAGDSTESFADKITKLINGGIGPLIGWLQSLKTAFSNFLDGLDAENKMQKISQAAQDLGETIAMVWNVIAKGDFTGIRSSRRILSSSMFSSRFARALLPLVKLLGISSATLRPLERLQQISSVTSGIISQALPRMLAPRSKTWVRRSRRHFLASRLSGIS